AAALRKRRPAKDEHRHVGTQGLCQLGKRLAVEPRFPQAVQRNERGGGVTGTTAQPRARGNILAAADLGTQRSAGCVLQCPGRPDAQVVRGRQPGQGGPVAVDAPVGADVEIEVIAQTDESKDGLPRVIAIGPTTGDVQKQIELGGCRNVVQSHTSWNQGAPGVSATRRTETWRVPSRRSSRSRPGPALS